MTLPSGRPNRSSSSTPPGRRWHKVRILTGLLVVLLGVGLVIAIPHLADAPALSSTRQSPGPPVTSETTGKQLPVVGQGPLVRVLHIRRDAGQLFGIDPFSNRLESTFTAAEEQRIGESDYVIQRFGYAAKAQRTISLTFDDGPDR